MKTATLIKLGANYVVEVEKDNEADDRPRLTFYRLELTETPTAEGVRALAEALAASPKTGG